MWRFDYYAPKTVAEAVQLLREKGEGGKILAGGTDLLPQMKERGRHPKYVVSLRDIQEMRGVSFNPREGLRIGAGTSCTDLQENAVISERYDIIAQGAALIGSIQTQNMASIGGNLCNAAPSADAVPPLIVLDGVAHIAGSGGSRTVPLAEFCTGPGQTVLRPDEVLADITIPLPPPRSAGVYLRHVPRKELDIAVAGAGVYVALDDGFQRFTHARICLASVAPTPLRVPRAEAALMGQPASPEVIQRAAQIASEECRPINDVRGSIAMRRHLVRVLTQRSLEQSVEKIRSARG